MSVALKEAEMASIGRWSIKAVATVLTTAVCLLAAWAALDHLAGWAVLVMVGLLLFWLTVLAFVFVAVDGE